MFLFDTWKRPLHFVKLCCSINNLVYLYYAKHLGLLISSPDRVNELELSNRLVAVV